MSKNQNPLLRDQLSKPLIGIAGGCFILFALVSVFLTQLTVREGVNKQIKLTSDIFSKSIRDDLIHGLDKEVYRKCLALSKEEDVVSIVVESSEPRQICNIGTGAESSFFSQTNLYFDTEESVKAGVLYLGFRSDIGRLLLIRIFIATLLVLFFVAAVYLFFARSWLFRKTHPFTKLAERLEKANVDDLIEVRKDFPSELSFEFHQLSSSVEKMASNWKSYQNELVQRERLEAVNQSSRILAHDIKSPLSALKTVLQTIDSKPEASKRLLADSVNRIEMLSKRIMISDGKIKNKDLKVMPLHSICTHLSDQLKTQYSLEKGINLVIDNSVVENGRLVLCELEELNRAVQNLVKNAFEAKINEHIDVEVKFGYSLNDFRVSVRDNGAGIPESHLKKVLDEGYTHGKGHGTGLGLSQVQNVINELDGQFKIESKQGKGTLVTISIPMSSKAFS